MESLNPKPTFPISLPITNYYHDLDDYEISLSLFNKCNMNCHFCFQSRVNDININNIKQIPDKLIEFIPNELIRTNSNAIKIRLFGGELFSDDISDDIFDVYRDLCNDIITKMKICLPKTNIKFACTSNGILENHQRLNQFLNDINGKISFSYDPIGRFHNEKQKKMFLATMDYFKDRIECLAITLTKPNIYSYIQGDEIFNSFSDLLDIDMNYYVANNGWEIELPSDDDLFNFYKWAIDNNKFSAIRNIIHGFIYNSSNQVINSCKCNNFTLYSNNKFMNDCVEIMSVLSRESFYGEYSNDVTWDNSSNIRASLGFVRRGCLFCEYKELCSGMCWCSILFDEYIFTECPLKRLYEYINDNPSTKKLYMNWRERYDKNWSTLCNG